MPSGIDKNLLAMAFALSVGGCAHRGGLPPDSSPSTNVGANSRGAVAYRFLLDPSAWSATLGEEVEFVEPSPLNALPMPTYPRAALAAKAGAAHVVVRIVIDTQGRIADVKDSPLESSSSGPFAGEFRDAVLRALRHWRFSPGHLDRLETETDGYQEGRGDYRHVLESNLVPVFYDVRFDFDIVGGEGHVRTSAASPG